MLLAAVVLDEACVSAAEGRGSSGPALGGANVSHVVAEAGMAGKSRGRDARTACTRTESEAGHDSTWLCRQLCK